MLKLKSLSSANSQNPLIPVSREIGDKDAAKAISVDIQELMNSISTPPEQEITRTIPSAEEENTPPPSPSDKELITIGNDDAPPLVLIDQDPIEHIAGHDKSNDCCILL